MGGVGPPPAPRVMDLGGLLLELFAAGLFNHHANLWFSLACWLLRVNFFLHSFAGDVQASGGVSLTITFPVGSCSCRGFWHLGTFSCHRASWFTPLCCCSMS